MLNTKLSSLENNVGVFTKYIGINANEFTVFEDTDSAEHLLVANAFGGQVLDMENGLADNSSQISLDVRSKQYEFGDPTVSKFIENIDCIFHGTEGGTFKWETVGDDENATLTTETITIDADTSQQSSISVNPLGTFTLTGPADDFLRRFKQRMPIYQQTNRIQIKLNTLLTSHSVVLEKVVFYAKQLAKEFFPTANIS